ncbi:MAG: hypothetical protein ACRDIV_19765 [Ktedonobacteraceae bacterium]
MVQLQVTGEAIERLLHRGVAQVEKEADLRRACFTWQKAKATPAVSSSRVASHSIHKEKQARLNASPALILSYPLKMV